jgi:hypothetical protein
MFRMQAEARDISPQYPERLRDSASEHGDFFMGGKAAGM